MGFETVPDTDTQYGLISFDAEGNERSEQSGLMSQLLIAICSQKNGNGSVFRMNSETVNTNQLFAI